jgi:hypothetical protein
MRFTETKMRSVRSTSSTVLSLLLALYLVPLSADEDRALVRNLTGQANVIRNGRTEALQVGSVIKDSDRIQTGNQSQVVVYYKGVEIRLRGATDATLLSLTDLNHGASVQLNKGFAWFKIEDPTKRGFKVQTPVSVAAVRGTKFAVGYDETGSTSCVCHGTVATKSISGNSENLVSAGGSHDYKPDGQLVTHDFQKYFKKLKVDRSFKNEIARDPKLENCKSCHRMTDLATDDSADSDDY